MSQVGFELMTTAFEWEMTVYALDHTVTVTGRLEVMPWNTFGGQPELTTAIHSKSN
jgi:hypothetical protein